MYCQVEVAPGNPENPETTKVVTVTHGQMSMEKKSKKTRRGSGSRSAIPFPARPEASRAISRADRAPDLRAGRGQGAERNGFQRRDGLRNHQWAVRRARHRALRHQANRLGGEAPGSKGFVAVGNSGHLRPPLSEFIAD